MAIEDSNNDLRRGLATCRALLRVCLAAWASLAAAHSPASAQTPQPWFRQVVVGMEVGPTGAQFGGSDPRDARYCAHWDGRDIVRRCAAANAEYLVLWVRDGDFAYYNSRILDKAPGLGDRDPLREAVEEARQLKLPLLSYCVVQQGGNFLEAHPEWKMKGADGQVINRFCLNSGYLQAMKEILAEQLAYGLAGFHVDMLDQGFGKPYGCWCDACRDGFQQQYGRPMPDGATWDEAWGDMLQFRYDSCERFERALADHVKSLDPQATVDFNYHGSPPFSFEVGQRPVQHAGNGDFVTGETGVWGFSALGVGLNAEFYRAATPGVPFQVAIQRGVRMYHDQTTRPLNDMRWETLSLLAHGAFVTMIDKTAFDGGLDPVAYERMGQVLGEARRKREHFGQAPVPEVGLYFSSRTRDWLGREEPARYFQSFQGAHAACAMEHLQFGVLLDENATLERLRRFPVVCLPHVGVLAEAEVARLKTYVSEGGALLVTGHSGQFDAWGRPLPQGALEELIGARVVKRLESQDNWVSLPPQADLPPLARDFSCEVRADWPFLVEGPATVYEPTTAEAFGRLHSPHRTARQLEGKMHTQWPMSADAAVGPAVLVNRVGQGLIVTCAASPDSAAAGEHALEEHRLLFRGLVRLLSPKPRLTIDAPSNVEAVVTDDPQARQLRVHLLAYHPTPRPTPASNRPYIVPGLMEDAPIYRATLVAAHPIRGVRAGDDSTRLQRDGQTIRATIEDIHEVIVLEY